jgi:uncharacterized protein (DUF3820 family)
MEKKLIDDSLMEFGEHKGKKLAEVPDSYLLGLYESGKCFGPIKVYIGENIDAIRANVEREKNLRKNAFKKN